MKLRLVGPESTTYEIPLDGGEVRVGRDAENDLVIPDRTISRFHFTLSFDQGTLLVTDDGSRYGTRLNGDPVTEPLIVVPGDLIEAGCFRGDVLDAAAEAMGRLPTVEMAVTPSPASKATRKTRLLGRELRRSRYSSGYIILLAALAAMGGLLLTYVLLDIL